MGTSDANSISMLIKLLQNCSIYYSFITLPEMFWTTD